MLKRYSLYRYREVPLLLRRVLGMPLILLVPVVGMSEIYKYTDPGID